MATPTTDDREEVTDAYNGANTVALSFENGPNTVALSFETEDHPDQLFNAKIAPTLKTVGGDLSDLFKSPDHVKTSTALQVSDKYRIDATRYCKLFRGYIRQDWDTINVKHGADELRAGWIDILFDLIFVACVVHISVEAAYSLPTSDHRRLAAVQTGHSSCDSGPYDFVLTCFSQFALLSLFWMEQTMFDTHF
eukprot:936765_1